MKNKKRGDGLMICDRTIMKKAGILLLGLTLSVSAFGGQAKSAQGNSNKFIHNFLKLFYFN